MLVLGIDEAGYGPLLGPLVVAGSALRVADDTGLDEFSGRFALALRGAGLTVGDSKRVFGATHDLATLEVPLLAFLGGSRGLDEFLAAVGVDPSVRDAAPWYRATLPRFPVRGRPDDVADAADRLRTALAGAGIEFVALAADVLPEMGLNAMFDAGNKADALFAVSSGVFDRLAAKRRPGEPVAAVFDRQGGRRFYAPALQRRWPDALVTPLDEAPRQSDYRLHTAGAATDVSFRVEADAECPQVGLASMLAKYLREVFMGLFNAHFEAMCPGVARTAGYVQDGRRWLAETRAVRVAAGVPDSALVRLR